MQHHTSNLATRPLPEPLKHHIQSRVPVTAWDLQALGAELVRRRMPKHGVLSRQGETSRELYFVERGCLRCYSTDSRGHEHVVRFAIEGWWLSDFHGYFTGEPSAFAIDALEESHVVVLNRSAEQRLCRERPVFARYFQGLLEGLAVATHRRLLGMMAGTVEGRYTEFLRAYGTMARRLPQYQVAAYLGVTPESLSRIRARIARRSCAAPAGAAAATDLDADQ